MSTWIFESMTDQGVLLVCVHAMNFIHGWNRATLLLEQAGYRPVKSNGHFGFATRACLAYQKVVSEGIIAKPVCDLLIGIDRLVRGMPIAEGDLDRF